MFDIFTGIQRYCLDVGNQGLTIKSNTHTHNLQNVQEIKLLEVSKCEEKGNITKEDLVSCAQHNKSMLFQK